MTSSEESTAAAAPAVAELREDLPLKAGGAGGGACCAGGPRLVLASFAALSAAITLALFTQIYCGDFEVVPHGGVSSDAAACSEAGTRALKDGGRALDAAAVAALCLAVLAPRRTSLDASGSLLYWEYRQARSQLPTVAEWGAGAPAPEAGPPRLLAALATLHALHGALPWGRILQPAIDLAKNEIPASSSAPAARGSQPRLAAYLESLQRNTSAELSAAWSELGAATPAMRRVQPAAVGGGWRLAAGGLGAAAVLRALRAARTPPPAALDDAEARVLSELQREAAAGGAWPPAPGGGVAAGLAVVDGFDTYVALVAGLSTGFGSGPATAEGWRRDEPAGALDLAPAILLEQRVCGTRYVLGGGSGAALAQAAAALAAGAGAAGVERARRGVLAGGVLAEETLGAAAVNVVQQRADALLTHADSRGGGLASRF